MSRQTLHQPGFPIQIHAGSDAALGRFIDFTDKRYAGTDYDKQGEGYIVEYSELFKFSTNLIGATFEDLSDINKIKELADKFLINIGIDITEPEEVPDMTNIMHSKAEKAYEWYVCTKDGEPLAYKEKDKEPVIINAEKALERVKESITLQEQQLVAMGDIKDYLNEQIKW